MCFVVVTVGRSWYLTFPHRPYGVEHGECPEVAAVDWAPVQVASCRKSLSGAVRQGPVCHERGGVSPALSTVWRHAARSPRHMEIRWGSGIYSRSSACPAALPMITLLSDYCFLWNSNRMQSVQFNLNQSNSITLLICWRDDILWCKWF